MEAKMANNERLRAAEKYISTLSRINEPHPSRIWRELLQSEMDLTKKVIAKLNKEEIKINFSDIQNQSINRILNDLKNLLSKADGYAKKLDKNEKKAKKYNDILRNINNINDYSIKKVMSDISGLTMHELTIISADRKALENLRNNIKIYIQSVEDLISLNDHGAVYDFSKRADILQALKRIENLDHEYASLKVREKLSLFDKLGEEFYELWLLFKNVPLGWKIAVAAVGIAGYTHVSNQEYQDKYGFKQSGGPRKEQRIDDTTKTTFNTSANQFINKK